jgi:protein-L-isoaspartate(D-aspartate) O-methyltransferase
MFPHYPITSSPYLREMQMVDDFRHKGMRKRLVRELALGGIHDSSVLQAMERVPRHFFLQSAFLEYAYEDKAFPIGVDQTISAPSTVAKQSQLLQIKSGMKVLEIGTGSGYQTAVLHELGAKIFSIERQLSLHEFAKDILNKMKVKAHLTYGNGYKGLPSFAPFDRIIITCATPEIPEELLMQLKPGGRLVMPFDNGDEQNMLVIFEDAKGEFQIETHGKCAFVPMLHNRNPRNTNA